MKEKYRESAIEGHKPHREILVIYNNSWFAVA